MAKAEIRSDVAAWNTITTALAQLDGATGRVGWFETAKYPDGTPVAGVAYVQEFGSAKAGIPPRPMFRSTIKIKQRSWRNFALASAKAILAGTETVQGFLEKMGMLAAGDIAKQIKAITDPPLKQATINARKRRYANKKQTGNTTKPLVDTALMVNSITNDVVMK